MSKITNLQAQLQKASSKVSAASNAPETGGYKAPSREGKVHIGAHLSPDFKRSLRLVQAQTGEDAQTLLARALNDLFRSHNVPVIEF